MPSYTQLLVQKRSLDPKESAEFVGGATILADYMKWKWLAPYIKGNRCTRFDLVDLNGCIDRHKREGAPVFL